MLNDIRKWLNFRNIEHTITESSDSSIVVLPIQYKYRVDPLINELRESNQQCDKVIIDKTVQLVLKGKPQNNLNIKLQSALVESAPVRVRKSNTKFSKVLSERLGALDGIGADFQPNDIISTLTKAIQKLGLHQKLLKLKIKMLVTKDKQYITFVRDAGGERIRLLQCATQTLTEPKDLEAVLSNLLDIADGKAPGASQLKLDQLKQISTQVSDVANQHAAASQQQQQQIQQPQQDGMLPV